MLKPQLLRTTAFRLALVYLGLFLVSVLAILGLIYWFTAGFIERQANETIAAEIAGLNEHYRRRGLGGLVEVVNERSAVQRTDMLYLVATPGLQPLAGNLSGWPEAPIDADGWMTFEIEDARTGDSRAHPARAIAFTLPGHYRLLVGRDMQQREEFQQRVVTSLAWALVFTIGLGVMGGVVISRNIMRRIDGINRTTRMIMTGQLHERVRLNGSGDELDQLAANLNAMLDQIERLMTGLRHVTESVAHDLRTPLTRMRSRLEIALLEMEAGDAARSALIDTIAEADRLLGVFSALLGIAEAEAGTLEATFRPVALAPLVRAVADLYEPVAEEKGIAFAADIPPGQEGEPVVRGNDQLLSQAVANLLDNAVKYTPPGGQVVLSVAPATAEDGASVTVADTGPGIPPELREKVLQRFVRLESSRSSPGNGLGLSLVDAVASLHGARLVLDDNNPGLRISLVFPPGTGS